MARTRAHTCAGCKEPCENTVQVGNARLCVSCVERVKAHMRHREATARPSQDAREAMRNSFGDKRRFEEELY